MILTESQRNTRPNKQEESISEISDLVLVHKTDYAPEGEIIKSSKDSGVLLEDKIKIGDKEYNIRFPSARETIHFAVNGEVTSHVMGNFDNRKYVIIIPFDKMDKDNLVGGLLSDTWSKGSVQIPQGSYILCPKAEMDKIKNQNRGINVVGYEGRSVDGYANMFLSSLGYKVETIGDYGWANSKDAEDAENIYLQNGLHRGGHTGSDWDIRDKLGQSISYIEAALEYARRNNIIENYQDFNSFRRKLIGRLIRPEYNIAEFSLDTIMGDTGKKEDFYEKVESMAHRKIPEETKKKWDEIYANKPDAVLLDLEKYYEMFSGKVIDFCTQDWFEKFINQYLEEYQSLRDKYKDLSEEERRDSLEKFCGEFELLEVDLKENEELSEFFMQKLSENGIEINQDAQSENSETIARRLTNRIDREYKDNIILGKTMEELTNEEEKRFSEMLQGLTIHENHKLIYVPTGTTTFSMDTFEFETVQEPGKHSPEIAIYGLDISSIANRLEGNKHFMDLEDASVSGKTFETDFLPMQKEETVSEYIDRMRSSMELIYRYANGEEIKFNDLGLEENQLENIKKLIESETLNHFKGTEKEIIAAIKGENIQTNELETGEPSQAGR